MGFWNIVKGTVQDKALEVAGEQAEDWLIERADREKELDQQTIDEYRRLRKAGASAATIPSTWTDSKPTTLRGQFAAQMDAALSEEERMTVFKHWVHVYMRREYKQDAAERKVARMYQDYVEGDSEY